MDYSALSRFSYGMYILTTGDGEINNAMLLSVAMQVTSDPAIVAVSITKQNYSHDLIKNNKKFNISVVNEGTPLKFLENFGFRSGRDLDKLKNVTIASASNGIPVVTENCNSYFEYEVVGEYDCGNNTVFFGKLTNTYILGAGKQMTLQYYQDVINGKISPNAPAWAARYTK